jgi:hypothetical protein
MNVTFESVKLGEIERIEKAMYELSKVSLPAREAWVIAKTLRAIKLEAEEYRNQRNSILAELGTTENGFNYQIAPEKIDLFNKKVKELSDVCTEIGFPAVDFKHFEKAQLTADAIEPLLEFMFPDMEGKDLE